jgi:hypothetical protein
VTPSGLSEQARFEAEAEVRRNGNGELYADVPHPAESLSSDAEEAHDLTESVDLDEFLATDEADHDWVVDGVLERAERVILTGEEGRGKSTLLRQIAVQVASGVHPFTLDPIPAVRTLLVDVENSPRHIRRKLRHLRDVAGDDYQPGHLRLEVRPEGLDLGILQDAAWLEERVRTNAADLVVMGPLYKLATGDPTREETARAVATALDTIRAITGVAVMIEAHTPYADGSKAKRPERPYGASLWSRWPEFGLYLAEDGTLRHWRGQRDERAWPLRLERCASWPWLATDEGAGPADVWHGPTKCMDAIVAFFADHPDEELSGRQLHDRLRALGRGYRHQTVHDAAELLVGRGEIAGRAGRRRARLYGSLRREQEVLGDDF